MTRGKYQYNSPTFNAQVPGALAMLAEATDASSGVIGLSAGPATSAHRRTC